MIKVVLGFLKPFAPQLILIGATFVIGGGALLGVRAFAKHHYNKGVAACESKQTTVDNELNNTVVPQLRSNLGDEEETTRVERIEVKETYRTGLTMSDIELAHARGKSEGEREGREEVYDTLRENGGCLVTAYKPTDQLLINAKRQQQRFIQSGIGSFKEPTTTTELSGRRTEDDPVPSDTVVGYIQPD